MQQEPPRRRAEKPDGARGDGGGDGGNGDALKITYSKCYGEIYTETSPMQRKIMDVFQLTLPT